VKAEYRLDQEGQYPMKRTFRVATVFTGVAAATAIAPTATAMAAVKPAITHETCNSSTKPWVHLYYTAAENHAPVCFGNNGFYSIKSGTRFLGVCPGNNIGSVEVLYPNNDETNFTFSPNDGGPSRRGFTTNSNSAPKVLWINITGHTAQYSKTCAS
jgi:hypothetical protein